MFKNQKTKYATYARRKITPPKRERRFFGKQKSKRATTVTRATIVSTKKSFAKGTGIIKLESPTTKRMLNKLLPIMFPTAISQFFLAAAITDVNNSGREVPKATMVSQIKLSLHPNFFAIKVAEFTTKRLPKITKPNPITVNASKIQNDLGFSSVS